MAKPPKHRSFFSKWKHKYLQEGETLQNFLLFPTVLLSSASCSFLNLIFFYTCRLLSFSIKLVHKGDYKNEDGANGKAKAASATQVQSCPQGQPGVAGLPQPTAHKSVCSGVESISKQDNLPWVNQKQTLANQDRKIPFYFIQNPGRKVKGLGWGEGWGEEAGTGRLSRTVNMQCLNFSFSKLAIRRKSSIFFSSKPRPRSSTSPETAV